MQSHVIGIRRSDGHRRTPLFINPHSLSPQSKLPRGRETHPKHRFLPFPRFLMAGTLSFAGLSPCPHRSSPSRHTACSAVAMAGVSTAVRRPKSLYEVLRVKETASAQEIKAGYRSMAKRFHPDVAPAAGGPDFLEIHRAYETLSDPTARARYDLSIGLLGLRAAAPLRSRRWETDQCW